MRRNKRNNEYNYVKWKLKSTLNLHYQTMSNNSFNAKLITEPMGIESNSILIMNYLVGDKLLFSTYTYADADQTYVKTGIYVAWYLYVFTSLTCGLLK